MDAEAPPLTRSSGIAFAEIILLKIGNSITKLTRRIRPLPAGWVVCEQFALTLTLTSREDSFYWDDTELDDDMSGCSYWDITPFSPPTDTLGYGAQLSGRYGICVTRMESSQQALLGYLKNSGLPAWIPAAFRDTWGQRSPTPLSTPILHMPDIGVTMTPREMDYCTESEGHSIGLLKTSKTSQRDTSFAPDFATLEGGVPLHDPAPGLPPEPKARARRQAMSVRQSAEDRQAFASQSRPPRAKMPCRHRVY